LDIIPTGMQSVYFFYDPAFSFLALGSVSVLREIDYMRRLQKYFPEFKYYYLSDYIQNCQRLKYKVEYEPAELLCPETRTWVKFNEDIRRRIDLGQTRLAEWNVKVAEDFDFKGIDLDQYVMWTARMNSQRLFEMDSDLAPRYLSQMTRVLPILGKKLFGDINFKIEIIPPAPPVIQAEPKQEAVTGINNLNVETGREAEKTINEMKIENLVLMFQKALEEKLAKEKIIENKIVDEEKIPIVKTEKDETLTK